MSSSFCVCSRRYHPRAVERRRRGAGLKDLPRRLSRRHSLPLRCRQGLLAWGRRTRRRRGAQGWPHKDASRPMTTNTRIRVLTLANASTRLMIPTVNYTRPATRCVFMTCSITPPGLYFPTRWNICEFFRSNFDICLTFL